MNIFRYVYFQVVRKPIKSLILISVITIIFFCELVGLCLYQVADKGEKDAFRYNGVALYLEEVDMNQELLEQLKQIPHVESVDNWRWYDKVYPVGMQSAKEHVGVEVEITNNIKNTVCFITHVDTKIDSWFWWEKSVFMMEGEFPTLENKGVLIESRFAEVNNLHIGDEAEFEIEGKKYGFKVCGIYKADTEFIIKNQEEIKKSGVDVYSYSPYNRIYASYEYLAQQMSMDIYTNSTWRIFTDSYASVHFVEQKVQEIMGEDVLIFNNADTYLESSTGIVSVMKNYAQLILGYVTIIGMIVLLIVFSYFASQYRYEAGIMMALGYHKIKAIGVYLITLFFMIIISFLLSIGVYRLASYQIVDVVEENVIQPFEDAIGIGSGDIEIPNLDNNFTLSIHTEDVLCFNNIIKMSIILIVFWLIASGIPIYIVLKTKPSFLLKDKTNGN